MRTTRPAPVSLSPADSFLDNAMDAILLISPDNKVLYSNRAFQSILDYSSGELNGRPIASIFRQESVKIMTLSDGSVYGCSKTGKLVRLAFNVLQLSIQGHTGRMLIFKKAKASRTMVNAGSRLIAMASHEFRSPLSRIMLSASLIEEYYERLDRVKIKDHLGRIKSAVNDMTATLEDFLCVGKLDAGMITARPEPVSIEDLIEPLFYEMQPQLKKGQKLKWRKHGDTSEIYTDPKLLKQCLINLLSNAVKYSGENCLITIDVIYGNDTWQLHLTDNGIGIPPADQQRIAEPFFRAGNTGDFEGTGLGLHIVYRVIRLLGGRIRFRSKEGKGTTFMLIFPNH